MSEAIFDDARTAGSAVPTQHAHPLDRAAAGRDSAPDLVASYLRALAGIPVPTPAQQASHARALARHREALLDAALGIRPVVAAIVRRWHAFRAAGRATGRLHARHAHEGSPSLDARVDRALAELQHLVAERAGGERLRAAARRAELAFEVVVAAFEEVVGAGGERGALGRGAAALAGYRRARSEFVRANLRLVVGFARRFRRADVPFLDLVQEGNIGLVRAVEQFDPERGLMFSTYAAWWIQQAMIRAIRSQARVVRAPSQVHEALARLRRAEERLRAVCAGEPGSADLAAALALPLPELDLLAGALAPVLSLHAPASGAEGPALEDSLCDARHGDPGAAIDQGARVRALPAAVAALPARERLVIELRFGLAGDPETLAQVGRRLGLSRERVRQIELHALAQLRRDAGPGPRAASEVPEARRAQRVRREPAAVG